MTDAYHALAIPRPGDFGLCTVHGTTGAFIRLGQWFLGRANPIDRTMYAHAFLVLDHGDVMEAATGGVDFGHLDDYLDERDAGERAVLFVDLGLTELERERVVAAAETLQDADYSYASYFYLFLLRLGLPSEWLRRRVASTHNFICSQLVDEAYRRAGIHLFNDGRNPQNVTPGDLARFAVTDPRARILS